MPGIAGAAGPTVNPFPTNPPPNVRWFFADQQADHKVCLRLPGDWCRGAKVSITGRILAQNGKGYDFQHQGFRLEIPEGASAAECARLICCLILEKCKALAQAHPNANVGTVCCDVVADPVAGVKILLYIKDATGAICPLVISFLSVCVECPRPGGVVIDDVTPPRFTTGDILTITGTGFGNNPDNLCVMINPGNGTAVPVLAVEATDNKIVGVVGPVRDNTPGVIQVTPGEGASGPGDTGCQGLLGGENTWSWGPVPGLAGAAGPMVNPFPANPPPNTRWFFADQQDNKVCLRLPVAWCPGAKVTITGRILAQNGKGYDFQHQGFTLDIPNGGSARECAQLICCLILEKCKALGAIKPGANTGTICCDVVPDAVGGAKILLYIKGADGAICPLVISFLSVCVECPRPGGVVIDTVTPTRFTTGDTIVITGTGFGNNPDNLCIKVNPGNGTAVPVLAVEATDTMIMAVVGPVRDDTPGVIEVTPGEGASGGGNTGCPGLLGGENTWSWGPVPGIAGAAGPTVNPFPANPPPNTRWFFADQQDNKVCLRLPVDWCRGAKVTITGRLLAQNGKGYDFQHQGFTLDIPNGGSARECAQLICCLILEKCNALGAIRPGANTGKICCDVVPDAAGGAKILLYIKGADGTICPLFISFLSVCVTCPAPCDTKCQQLGCCEPTGCAGVKVTTVLPPDQCKDDVYVTIRSLCKGKVIKECRAQFDLPGGDPANPILCAEFWSLQDKCRALVRAIRKDCTSSGYAVEEHCDQNPPFFIVRDVTCPGSQVVLGISNDPNIFGQGGQGQPIPDYEAEIIEPLCDDPADPPVVDIVLRGTANGVKIVEEMPTPTVAIVLRRTGGGTERAEVATTPGMTAGAIAKSLVDQLKAMGADASLIAIPNFIRLRKRAFNPAGIQPGGGSGGIVDGFDGFAGATNDEGITLGNMGGPESAMGVPFLRGDTNDDGRLLINDPILTLGYLFFGSQPPTCLDAADSNDDGSLDISDPVGLLGYLFLGSAPPKPPGPPGGGNTCGVDPTPNDASGDIGCLSYTNC